MLSIRIGCIGHGVNKRAGFIQYVRGKRSYFIGLLPAICKGFEENRNIKIRIRPCVAARPRAEQHHTLDPISIKHIKRGTKFGQGMV